MDSMHSNRYDPSLTNFMELELVKNGFKSLKSSKDVVDFFNKNKDFLLVVNSVCGCAAANARPGVKRAFEKNKEMFDSLPKATVFAGVDIEATTKAREYFPDYPTSSPNIILFKEGKPIFFAERKDLVHKSDEEIGEELLKEVDVNFKI